MSDLPASWIEPAISEVAEVNPRKDVDLSASDLVSFVPMAAVDEITGTVMSPVDRPYGEVSKGFTHFRDDDVIFAKITPSMENGKSAVARGLTNGTGMGSTEFHVFRSNGAVEPEYLWRFLRQKSFRENAQAVMSGAVGQQRVPADYLKDHLIPLAPLPEQRRIMARVDGLTARTARARKELDRIPTLIARYKQRLLALAFSGHLTAGWRMGNPSLQTALEQVRLTRKGENRLARRKRATSVPDYEIPGNWDWISPDEVAADAKYSIGIGPFGSNLVRADYRESGVRLVFVRDIRREKFEDSDARYVDESKAAELHQHIASPGDVLITKMGDPPGDSSLFPMDAEPAVITADCIKLTPHGQLATAKYLNFAIRSEIVQSQFKAITAGVAQQKVSLDRFRQLALPIAPLDEQAEIVRRIESAFGWLDRMAADHAAAARLLPKLEAAIFAKAFRGELVPQDPNDEPAAKMLERIKAVRTADVAKPKTGRGRPRQGGNVLLASTDVVSPPVAYANSSRPKGKQGMTKSRQDDDVKDKPYLAGLLKSGRFSDAQSLFRAADLPVADFYKQLAWEIDNGHILDIAEELKAA